MAEALFHHGRLESWLYVGGLQLARHSWDCPPPVCHSCSPFGVSGEPIWPPFQNRCLLCRKAWHRVQGRNAASLIERDLDPDPGQSFSNSSPVCLSHCFYSLLPSFPPSTLSVCVCFFLSPLFKQRFLCLDPSPLCLLLSFLLAFSLLSLWHSNTGSPDHCRAKAHFEHVSFYA